MLFDEIYNFYFVYIELMQTGNPETVAGLFEKHEPSIDYSSLELSGISSGSPGMYSRISPG